MSALYSKGRESFLKGEISWSSDNIRLALINTLEYTVDIDNHQYLSDVNSQAIIATSNNFIDKTTSNGVADAADILFSGLTGAICQAAIIYQHTGTSSTSRLIAYIDAANGLPVTPNGSDITITWANNYNKIFKL